MSQTVRRIMLVEDDKEIVNIYKQILELEGYYVTAAYNGKEALDCLTNQPKPNLILLDLMMPIMDGREFLKVLQSNLSLKSIPVVVLSAVMGQQSEGLDGIAAFLKKPIEIDTLLRVIEVHKKSN